MVIPKNKLFYHISFTIFLYVCTNSMQNMSHSHSHCMKYDTNIQVNLFPILLLLRCRPNTHTQQIVVWVDIKFHHTKVQEHNQKAEADKTKNTSRATTKTRLDKFQYIKNPFRNRHFYYLEFMKKKATRMRQSDWRRSII